MQQISAAGAELRFYKLPPAYIRTYHKMLLHSGEKMADVVKMKYLSSFYYGGLNFAVFGNSAIF